MRRRHPLSFAAEQGHVDVAATLLLHGATINGGCGRFVLARDGRRFRRSTVGATFGSALTSPVLGSVWLVPTGADGA